MPVCGCMDQAGETSASHCTGFPGTGVDPLPTAPANLLRTEFTAPSEVARDYRFRFDCISSRTVPHLYATGGPWVATNQVLFRCFPLR
jgi:hypothetical protein